VPTPEVIALALLLDTYNNVAFYVGSSLYVKWSSSFSFESVTTLNNTWFAAKIDGTWRDVLPDNLGSPFCSRWTWARGIRSSPRSDGNYCSWS
jgi:hypothetical protein